MAKVKIEIPQGIIETGIELGFELKEIKEMYRVYISQIQQFLGKNVKEDFELWVFQEFPQ